MALGNLRVGAFMTAQTFYLLHTEQFQKHYGLILETLFYPLAQFIEPDLAHFFGAPLQQMITAKYYDVFLILLSAEQAKSVTAKEYQQVIFLVTSFLDKIKFARSKFAFILDPLFSDNLNLQSNLLRSSIQHLPTHTFLPPPTSLVRVKRTYFHAITYYYVLDIHYLHMQLKNGLENFAPRSVPVFHDQISPIKPAKFRLQPCPPPAKLRKNRRWRAKKIKAIASQPGLKTLTDELRGLLL